MKKSKNYNLPLPEGSDEMLIEQVSEGIGKLDEELGKTDKKISDHLADKNNPHGLTNQQIINLLGFTPANSNHTHNISDISGLANRLTNIESRIALIESKALTVSSWSDIASVSVTTSNTGDIDECYNFISGSLTTVWGQSIPIRTVSEMNGASWGNEEQSTRSAYLDFDGNLYLRYHDTDEHGNDISHPSGTIYITLAGMGETYTYTRTAPITTDFDD